CRGRIMLPCGQRGSLSHCPVTDKWMLCAPIWGSIILAACACLAVQAQIDTHDHKQADMRLQLLQFVSSGQLGEAMSLGEKAATQWPEDAYIHHYLGLAYFKSGKLQLARDQLVRARDLNQKDSG